MEKVGRSSMLHLLPISLILGLSICSSILPAFAEEHNQYTDGRFTGDQGASTSGSDDMSNLRLTRHAPGWQYDQHHAPTPAAPSTGVPSHYANMDWNALSREITSIFNHGDAESYAHLRKIADQASAQTQ